MVVADFARKLRDREKVVGYWTVLDSPVATERIARLGYDYLAVDGQHGLVDNAGIVRAMLAVDAGGRSAGVVRVEANDPTPIGQALDAGAAAVIVPLVNDAEDAAAAVRATRYPPNGVRSYGPMRSGLRIGPKPAEADAATATIAMIETANGLENVDRICATPGLDGVYVGPSDLCLAVGGAFPGDPDVSEVFEEAVAAVRYAAEKAGVAAGIHTLSGETAARRIAEGYTFASISSDLVHLEQTADKHLKAVTES